MIVSTAKPYASAMCISPSLFFFFSFFFNANTRLSSPPKSVPNILQIRRHIIISSQYAIQHPNPPAFTVLPATHRA